ncbi:cell division protein ZapA [Methylovulum psychrotolerans]|jgi:cell division protein ZapA|uniref:Cell division protein ZapA n=1 Tax=Methylovulum psychrotolerans TaxID=1704499 RepID=A0A1Z4BVZ5_9GAMM|nr:cell division protein ZapA [Methylovulum psychrotolerans]ASF45423.1 cell division protein ZapA [Methylovulum psychrotolerans]MBT9099351.1 cell division protein ZapA [Methylovulum psychrotolerans]POZ50088.1 cell division protein ZapA [Methylovulum psychrotolerans]
MTNRPHAVALMIMGKEYRIACDPEEQDDLLQSAQQLDMQMRKMRDSGKVNGADRIAVIAALNLAHELQIAKNQNLMLKQQLSDSLANIGNKIENVLENS